ncbi:MAG: NifB/NifX family molybdenum-iron cluster-binding protein, partial [Desulfobaccales bacterium]
RRQPGVLKFALPVSGGKLSEKFGDASHFALLTAGNGSLKDQELMPAPPPEPGGLPEWLDDLGVTHVIAAGLGAKAEKLLTHKGIEVIAGPPQGDPRELVEQYLKKTPAPGAACGSQCTKA